jgi:hypothetical protein
MKFGTKIRMLRDYDGGRFEAGEVYEVGMGEPEDGQIMPAIAKTLCGPAADGDGPFAEKIEEETSDDDSTDNATSSDEE